MFDILFFFAEVYEIFVLFFSNFIKCLLNNLSVLDNYFYECVVDCLVRIVVFVLDKKMSLEKKIVVIVAF